MIGYIYYINKLIVFRLMSIIEEDCKKNRITTEDEYERLSREK